MSANTVFLRLEGPLQAWGGQGSKFLIRRTAEAPTKSGIIGMLCAAMGISRRNAAENCWLARLADLRMGVRIDRPGIRWWDYHTVGARMLMRKAEGDVKHGAMLTRREYLCDASFLVALQGDPMLIEEIREALARPQWTLYLGRKCCPPSMPIMEKRPNGCFPDLLSALKAVPWRKRFKDDAEPEVIDCLLDWRPTQEEPAAPVDALVWHDVPVSFDPPAHKPRFVIRTKLRVGAEGDVQIDDTPLQQQVQPPARPRADYSNSEYRKAREARMKLDHGLCVFCKAPATTVQHVTYRRAGGNEKPEDLRTLCRLCHDAVTMLEYGLNMGLDRIDPEEPRWREKKKKKREEIIRFRSLETRRRKLRIEEV